MPDITMCCNDDCPLAKKCYRHEAQPGDWRSYFYNFEGRKDCQWYWPMEEKDESNTCVELTRRAR